MAILAFELGNTIKSLPESPYDAPPSMPTSTSRAEAVESVQSAGLRSALRRFIDRVPEDKGLLDVRGELTFEFDDNEAIVLDGTVIAELFIQTEDELRCES